MNYEDRINFKGDLKKVVDRIVIAFSLGELESFNVIEVGFEDLNMRIVTESGVYLAKIFSNKRNNSEINRYVSTIEKVVSCDVRHPKLLHLPNKSPLYSDEALNLKLVLMHYIKGRTFYELDQTPTQDELYSLSLDVVKIHNMDYKPAYIFDSWAVSNFEKLYKKIRGDLTSQSTQLVDEVLRRFELIPINNLPRCFIHGDITKANTIRGANDNIYIIDFAVSNIYPRIQELAIMSANLLYNEEGGALSKLRDRCELVANTYVKAGGELTPLERDSLFSYALAAAAMEYLGSVNERINSDTSTEALYWEKLGLENMQSALAD